MDVEDADGNTSVRILTPEGMNSFVSPKPVEAEPSIMEEAVDTIQEEATQQEPTPDEGAISEGQPQATEEEPKTKEDFLTLAEGDKELATDIASGLLDEAKEKLKAVEKSKPRKVEKETSVEYATRVKVWKSEVHTAKGAVMSYESLIEDLNREEDATIEEDSMQPVDELTDEVVTPVDEASEPSTLQGDAPVDNNSKEDTTPDIAPTSEAEQPNDVEEPKLERNQGEDIYDFANRVVTNERVKRQRGKVDKNPTEAQKEAGNYKKGHVKIDGFDVTIENAKGSERSGVDKDGTKWSVTMNNDYGYIRGTKGKDGDHIDIFLGDSGNGVFVVDQVNSDGEFDEHKVMYGFSSTEEAKAAYLSNYSPGWNGLGNITEISKEDFKEWVNSSKRKTKAFSEYKKFRMEGVVPDQKHEVSYDKGPSMVSVPSSVGDTKLAVSSLPLDTKVDVVSVEGEPVSYEEAKKLIDELPSSINTLDGITLNISSRTKKKLKNELSKNRGEEFYIQSLRRIQDIVSQSILLEEHSDRIKIAGERKANNPSDSNIDKIQRFYGAAQIGGRVYRVKTTAIVPNNSEGRMHNYEVTKIELLPPIANARQENAYTTVGNNSISLAKLVEGVELSYEKGKLLSDAIREAHEKTQKPTADNLTVDAIVEQLKKSGLAERVIIDQEAFDKKLEELDGKRLHSVYHGSPYSFEAFDHSKMGTGEGAQAYGWGTYVTEVEGIAKRYATELADRTVQVSGDSGLSAEEVDHIKLMVKNGATSVQQLIDSSESRLMILKQTNLTEVSDGFADSTRLMIKRYERILPALKSGEVNISFGDRNLYSVEIPDEDTPNEYGVFRSYIKWEEDVSDSDVDDLLDAMRDEFENDEDILLVRGTGQQVYESISESFGSDEKASKFLEKCGYIGISYPAEHQSGGRKDGARNYVIFNEKDAKITERIQFLKDGNSTVYGFVVDDVVYLNPSLLNTNTPIHEFAHLWNNLIRSTNPKLWREGKRLVRKSAYWEEVESNPEYANLNEEEKVDEALARAIADHGQRTIDLFGVKYAGLRAWAQKVWQRIKDILGIKGEMTLEDFSKRAFSDLFSGVSLVDASQVSKPSSPRYHREEGDGGYTQEMLSIKSEAETNGTFMKAPNGNSTNLNERQWLQVRTKAFKDWFGDWEKKAKFEVLKQRINGRKKQQQVEYSDEFRRVQEGSRALSEHTKSEYRGAKRKIYEESGFGILQLGLRGQLHAQANSSGNKIRSLVDKKGNQFNIIEDIHGQLFHDIFEIVRNYLENGELVDLHDNYDNCVCYITEDGLGGFAVEENGNLVSVFNLNPYISFLSSIKDYVTECGATHLDSYNSKAQPLAEIYKKTLGWQVASMMDYNMEYDHDNIAENHGNPQVAFMVNTPDSIQERAFDKDSYDEAEAYQLEQRDISLNNASKVVDENGEPMVVYHGTTNYEDILHGGYKEGRLIHLTPRKDIADSYQEWVKGGSRGTLELYVRVINPAYFDANGKKYSDYRVSYDIGYANHDAKKEGKDGLIIQNIRDHYDSSATVDQHTTIVAYSPNQIKSATENVGTFSVENPDIRFRRSEEALRESDGEVFARGQLEADIPEGFASTHFAYEPNLAHIYADPTAYYELEKLAQSNGGVLPEGWEYDFSPDDFELKEGYVCCKRSDNYEYPAFIAGAADDTHCVFFEGEEIAKIYDGVVAKVGHVLDVWKFEDGKYVRVDDKGKETRFRSEDVDNSGRGGNSLSNIKRGLSIEDAVRGLARELRAEVEIVTDTDKITHPNPRIQERMRKSKGWFDSGGGKVVIVLPNATSPQDACATIFHEVIGHKGLREMYGDRFTSVIDRIYQKADEGIRKEIAGMSAKYGWDVREATEEYIAQLAERGFSNKRELTFWQLVKRAILEFFDNLGYNVGFALTDADLRYMLWRSYQARRDKGDILSEARDIDMRRRMGVREFGKISYMPDVRFRVRFENPSTGGARFRDGGLDSIDAESGSTGMARELYDNAVKTNHRFTMYKFKEGQRA